MVPSLSQSRTRRANGVIYIFALDGRIVQGELPNLGTHALFATDPTIFFFCSS
jgi:hypothetical protein